MRKWLLLGMLLSVLGAGYLIAQVDLEEALTCDPTELVFNQLDLQAELDTFAADLSEDPTTALERLYETGVQYQEMALECGYIPADAGDLFVGTDIDRIMNILETVPGDPINGQLLYNDEAQAADGNTLGCLGCHRDDETSTGPQVAGTWTRWDEIHSLESRFEGYTFERYIVESIIDPWAYTVDGYPENIMPNNFGDRLSYQNLADLIAYLSSQDQLLD
ncbi:MAG: hypothetical protein Kow00117_07350 [Phototrophicales bacterium]